jgi:AcrR family transcriptional regulator
VGREYVLKRRADRMDETRRRITEAVVDLHGTVGAAHTTISAIAARAGVERLTVYRHFPDDAALLEACTAHWRAAHPAPDPAAWDRIADPATRLRAALADFYAYYRHNRGMLWNSVRDRASVPALDAQMAALDAHLRVVGEGLAQPWRVGASRRRRLAAAIGHALDFRAWLSLDGQGLSDRAAADLMVGLVRAAAIAPRPRQGRAVRGRPVRRNR